VVNWAIRIAANAGVSSLLDHDEDRWREITASKTSNSYQSFLTHARSVVEVLRDGVVEGAVEVRERDVDGDPRHR